MLSRPNHFVKETNAHCELFPSWFCCSKPRCIIIICIKALRRWCYKPPSSPSPSHLTLFAFLTLREEVALFSLKVMSHPVRSPHPYTSETPSTRSKSLVIPILCLSATRGASCPAGPNPILRHSFQSSWPFIALTSSLWGARQRADMLQCLRSSSQHLAILFLIIFSIF